MKNLILIFTVTCLFFSCTSTPPPISFEINKRIVYNRACDFVLYSTNKNGFFTPNIHFEPFSVKSQNRSLKMPTEGNYYVRDASCDCKYVLLVAEKLHTNKYDIYLYDLHTDTALNITDEIHANFEDPLFLNQDNILFLVDNSLYSYRIKEKIWESYSVETKFKHLFMGDDNYIFLQDSESSIWMFNIDQQGFKKIWDAPKIFSASRKIKANDGKIFFMSDHETGFNNIYTIALDSLLLNTIISDQYDYFLPNNTFFLADTLIYIKNKGLNFLSNVSGTPKDGVIYDFVAKNDSLLLLYSSPEKPASLYLVSESGIIDLLQQIMPTKSIDMVIESKIKGVDNLLFLPPTEIKHWVVWLHGGPHEQVSFRFNPYIYHLTMNNIGVIALNYPGSTGKGRVAELHNLDQKDRLKYQLEVIKQDLNIIVDKYNIDSFSLVGVSYGTILAHKLAENKDFNIRKLIDFSGINTNKNIVGSSLETLYIMGEHDFILTNRQRDELLEKHKEKGAKILILKEDGHSISHYSNITKTLDEMAKFLLKE